MEPAERARLMKEGQRAFNKGEFYEAHEFWEAVWDVIDDPDRRWVQGMIQVATGLHKLSRDQPAVCRTLLTKAVGKLIDVPAVFDGFQVGALRSEAERLLAALETGQPAHANAVKLKSA